MFRLCLLVAVYFTLATTEECPMQDLSDKCSCITHYRVAPELHITCYGLTDPDQVLQVLKGAANVASLRLVGCNLPFLPLGLPQHGLAKLEIVNSTVPHISTPLSSASVFDGLQNLTSITVKGVRDLSSWDWSKMAQLKHLQNLHIEDTRLPVLPAIMSTFNGNQFWSLNITNTQTRSIAPTALGSPKLRKFSSRGNPLGSVRAAMFHPGRAIAELEFVGTKVTSLGPRELAELSQLSIFVTDAHMLSFLGQTPFHTPLHSFTILGAPAPCHFKYCFLRQHGLQWDGECILETSTVTATFIMADFLNTAC